MVDSDRSFAGSIPALYDRYLGPFIFQPYAEDLAARTEALAPRAVLETAAGTGLVSAAVASILPAAASFAVTDLNPAMIEVAKAKPGMGNASFQPADATDLPFTAGSFDLVLCQFGAMFFPDKGKGFREAFRVLRPGGTFLFNVWDRIETNEVTQIVDAAVAALYPADPPHFLLRTPHGYYDRQAIAAELAAAGFGNVTVETVARRGQTASSRDPAVGFCQGSPLRNEILARDPAGLAAATEAAAAALDRRFGPGPLDAPIQAIVVSAARG